MLLGLWGVAQAEPQPWKVDCGETVTIKATAKTGYEFDQWNDGVKENPREVAVNENIDYIAHFKETTPTAVDNTQSMPKPRKVIIEDKMYIILGDQLYDATGKRVR